MCGNERLVRRDNRLASLQRSQDQFTRVIDTTDDFHDNVDIIARNQGACIIRQLNALHLRRVLVLLHVGDCNATHFERATDTLLKIVRKLLNEAQHFAAHGALAQNGHTDRLTDSLARVVTVTALCGFNRHL